MDEMEKASAVSGKTWFSSLSVNGFGGSNVFDSYISRHKQDINKQVDYSYSHAQSVNIVARRKFLDFK